MSYILDALRRAEAERSAMQAPDLNRLGTVAATPTANLATRHRPGGRWALLALALVAVAVVVTFLAMSRREPTPALPPVATSTQGRGVPRAEPPPLPVDMAPPAPASAALVGSPSLELPRNPMMEREQPPRPAAADMATSRPPIIAASAPSNPAPGTADRRAANAVSSPAVPPQPLPTVPAPPAPPAPLQSAASQPVAIPSRDELPAEVRRTLPPFGIGGTVYSPDPSRRMLIVDGELWREGDQIRPDLVIEQIRPRDAVLRYRGLRFSVAP